MNSWKNYLDNNAKVIFGCFEDPADGKRYKTITIGNQTWMAENYTKEVDGSYTVLDPVIGRLYSPSVMDALAPEGWHIPTQGEWEELVAAIREAQGDDIAEALHPPFLKNYVDETDLDFKPNELFVVRCVKDAQAVYVEHREVVQDNAEQEQLRSDNNELRQALQQKEAQLADATNKAELYKKRFDELQEKKNAEITRYREDNATLYEKYKSETQKLTDLLNVKDQIISKLNNDVNIYRSLCETLKKQILKLAPGHSVPVPEPKQEEVIVPPSPDDFVDERDNQRYRTVRINGKVWLAQNLRFKDGLSEKESCSPENNAEYDKTFGRLYTWSAAQKACPAGWHLPTVQEWNELHEYMSKKYGNQYKKQLVAPILWRGEERADFDGDKEGLSFLPAGYALVDKGCLEGKEQVGFSSRFWTSQETNSRMLGIEQNRLSGVTTSNDWGFSVRCVKNED